MNKTRSLRTSRNIMNYEKNPNVDETVRLLH